METTKSFRPIGNWIKCRVTNRKVGTIEIVHADGSKKSDYSKLEILELGHKCLEVIPDLKIGMEVMIAPHSQPIGLATDKETILIGVHDIVAVK